MKTQQIEITLNGEQTTIEPTWSLAQAVAEWGYDVKGIAIALNADFVHRDTYNKRYLQAGDTLEIVAPFAGG